MSSVSSLMVEFHRFAGRDVLRRESRYVRTAGWDRTARDLSPPLDQEDLLTCLYALRYRSASVQEASSARKELASAARHFLEDVLPASDGLVQLDLVTNANELWVFPFEACFEHHEDWLKNEASGVVLTRRIRGDFSEAPAGWPAVPRVLFAHAPAAPDLAQSLIDGHEQALRSALADWFTGRAENDRGLLLVQEVTSATDLERIRDQFAPTYVHVLAHGAATRSDPLRPDRTTWGLRLGFEGEPGVPPADVAEALRPVEGSPLVVTLAACDSANQAGSIFAVQSVAQELHRCGVPVVIGSQLPLTKEGSLVLARAFYERLLRGEDVRAALHAARVRLRAEAASHHDWLSLVGYVRLPPESYAEHLEEVGLRMELRLLEVARTRALRLNEDEAGLGQLDAEETSLQTRIDSLRARRARLPNRRDLQEECNGLEASASKRLAELRFACGLRQADTRDDYWTRSREALREAWTRYRAAYEADLHSHWLGAQQLSLEAVLTGHIANLGDWLFTQRAAEIARDTPPCTNFWSCGTLAELALLAPCAGRPRDVDGARAALTLLVERAQRADEPFGIESTRRQLGRYVEWWTNDHGFFPGREDLSKDAQQLLPILS